MFKLFYDYDGNDTVVETAAEAVELGATGRYAPAIGLLNPCRYLPEALRTVYQRVAAAEAQNEWTGARFEGLLEPIQRPSWREMREFRKDRFTVFTGDGQYQLRWPNVAQRACETGLRSGLKEREVSL